MAEHGRHMPPIPDSPKAKRKMHKVMREFKQGTLKSGGGGRVKKRKQAVAIAASEARKGRSNNG